MQRREDRRERRQHLGGHWRSRPRALPPLPGALARQRAVRATARSRRWRRIRPVSSGVQCLRWKLHPSLHSESTLPRDCAEREELTRPRGSVNCKLTKLDEKHAPAGRVQRFARLRSTTGETFKQLRQQPTGPTSERLKSRRKL